MAFDLFAGPQPKVARPHQTKAMEMLRASLASGRKRPCLQLPTGAGKTFIASLIVRGALAKGNRVVFTVPALSLVDQTVAAFEAEGVERIGVIQADHPRTDAFAPVQVASVQTLARRDRPAASVVVVDECHIRSEAVVRWMREAPTTRFVGLSATPWRKGMAEEFDDLLVPVTMQELIDAGFLAPFRVFAPSQPDLSGVRTERGDYVTAQLAEVMGDGKLVADVVTTWLEKGEGRPTLCFAVDRAHAKKLQAEFEAVGIGTGYVDAFTPDVERRLVAERLRRGEIRVVCNVNCLTTGVDWDVRCIIAARPTRSEMLWVQQVGRGLRTAPGKDALILLDHSDNTLRLGFVTEIGKGALLGGETRKAERQASEPMPKACPTCSFVKAPKVRTCPCCGFTPEARSEIETVAGELVELGTSRKPKPPTMEEKQRFWSMALWVDIDRHKGGRLAKALYKGKFGVWPKGLKDRPVKADDVFLAYERSRRIAFAKSMEARHAA